MVKETGIIMTGEHPKLILDNRKTMTRRTRGLKEINECPDLWEWFGFDNSGRYSFRFKPGDRIVNIRCPYGQVGDRLWVRETWATEKRMDNKPPSFLGDASDVPLWYRVNDRLTEDRVERGKWRPSIFMPRWASRLTLEITALRVERLQEITPRDCEHEGIDGENMLDTFIKNDFRILWDSLNTKRGYGWEKNPWVWVISFKRLTLGDDR